MARRGRPCCRHVADLPARDAQHRSCGLAYNTTASLTSMASPPRMTVFSPYSAILGGLLIGISALWLLLSIGRIAGVTGIIFGLFPSAPTEWAWRLAFLAGLGIGTALMIPIETLAFAPRQNFPLWALLCAGFLVGYGTRLGNGCTSGHGVCGLGRRAPRSLAATLTFMTVAMATVLLMRHTLGVLP